MSTQIQESIQQAYLSLQQYGLAVEAYNHTAPHAANSWEEQRQAYDAWVNVNYTYTSYVADINAIKNALTNEVLIPVTMNSYVGIGILGLGIVYLHVSINVNGGYTHPIWEIANPETGDVSINIAVGGLPDGTIIYTNTGTYTIQEGQAVLLAQVG